MPQSSGSSRALTAVLSAAALVGVAVWLLQKWRRSGTVQELRRYAIKGMGGDALQTVALTEGCAFPADRVWALIRGDKAVEFNPKAPEWLHKSTFHCAFSAGEALARLHTRYDADTTLLTVDDAAGQRLASGRLGVLSECAQMEVVAVPMQDRGQGPSLWNNGEAPFYHSCKGYRDVHKDPNFFFSSFLGTGIMDGAPLAGN